MAGRGRASLASPCRWEWRGKVFFSQYLFSQYHLDGNKGPKEYYGGCRPVQNSQFSLGIDPCTTLPVAEFSGGLLRVIRLWALRKQMPGRAIARRTGLSRNRIKTICVLGLLSRSCKCWTSHTLTTSCHPGRQIFRTCPDRRLGLRLWCACPVPRAITFLTRNAVTECAVAQQAGIGVGQAA